MALKAMMMMMTTMIAQSQWMLLVLCIASIWPACCSAHTVSYSQELSDVISKVRESFIPPRAYFDRGGAEPFDTLNVALLTRQTPQDDWVYASYNDSALTYPASCMKLALLVSAQNWCHKQSLGVECIDGILKPMITVSSNFASQETFAVISEALNSPSTGSNKSFEQWFAKRNRTQEYLDRLGLLGNQRIVLPTYDGNGDGPWGKEETTIQVYGGNRMQPGLMAFLMLGIVNGTLEPQGRDYMLKLLSHERFGEESEIGFGTQAGTTYYNKPGVAYSYSNDIAYMIFPDGREVVMAINSNSYQRRLLSVPQDTAETPPRSVPYDASQIGVFSYFLFKALNWTSSQEYPEIVISFADHEMCNATSRWQLSESSLAFNQKYLLLDPAASQLDRPNRAKDHVICPIRVPKAGRYEVTVWFPQAANQTNASTLNLGHSQGVSTMALDQTANGARWVLVGEFSFGESGDARIEHDQSRHSEESLSYCHNRSNSIDAQSDTPSSFSDDALHSAHMTDDWMAARRAQLAKRSCSSSSRSRADLDDSGVDDLGSNFVLVSPGSAADDKLVVADTIRLVYIP